MISVAMASFNGERYIKNQIDSILMNLNDTDELVISDDGSTDNTIDIINSYNDKRIHLISGPKKGINKNFENAIIHCNGDIIFLSDQDDVWYEGKVTTVLEAFNKYDCLLVQHDAVVKDGEGNVLYDSFANHRRVRCGVFKNWLRNSYHGCLIAFKKELVESVVPFPSTGCFHDQWIGIISDSHKKSVFIDEVLMEYRRYGSNASSFVHEPFFTQLKKRIILLVNLVFYFVGSGRRC
ncbi:MAG: glycosyltransferase [Saccharofermentans sp.]|nr:glycosyltransferase [Saccharofermentans sp.]